MGINAGPVDRTVGPAMKDTDDCSGGSISQSGHHHGLNRMHPVFGLIEYD